MTLQEKYEKRIDEIEKLGTKLKELKKDLQEDLQIEEYKWRKNIKKEVITKRDVEYMTFLYEMSQRIFWA